MRKLLLLLLFAPTLTMAEQMRVFSSVVPVQTFVEKVGGKHVDSRVMVRPGFNPHTYDPTPQQISALAESSLYVRTGVPFENAWMGRIRAANSKMQVIDTRAGIDLRKMEAHDDDDHAEETDHHEEHKSAHAEHAVHKHHDEHLEKDHAHEKEHKHGHEKNAANDHHDEHAHEQDPHVWVSPSLAIHMIGRIRDKLSELAPQHAADFARNHDAYASELRSLDNEMHTLLDPLHNRKFLVFHPAWGYFADQYNLKQVPIEQQGKRPGPRALAALIEQAKHEQIKVVFVQPQFDKRQARQVAKEIGGGVITVDPLAANYVENLRHVGQQFAKALQH